MEDLCIYAERPLAFVARYVKQRKFAHAAILASVLGAVMCSVGAQYGLKALIDVLAAGPGKGGLLLAFVTLTALISADNLFWRLAGWIGSFTFASVSGDLRRDLFRHLTGHAQTYFLDRLPGMLTSRITGTSNAVYTLENMFVSNVLPPLIATLGAIVVLFSVSTAMAGVLAVGAVIVIVMMFRVADAGKPLHHNFADKAAAVDGEMVDVIANMPLVRAFGGIRREHNRFDETVNREVAARKRSLFYLEKLRLGHAVLTILLSVGLLTWAILLWQRGAASTGDVVLVCTLGIMVLHATRDLAVALVDVTQHLARLSEALETLLIPQELLDHPEAIPLQKRHAGVSFEEISFHYPDGRKVFSDFSLHVEPGQRVGLVGPSGSGKSTLFALLQRSYDVQRGRIVIYDQNITRVTQESLRAAMSLVPQDISLLHRSVMENIRYGRPDASDAEVMEAALAAKCEFIETLPEKFSTIVGDRGIKLSGGQRQRIAIARAFLKDASIVLLDEATAALDLDSEELIREALIRLMRGRTVIAIAHRLPTLRSFDRIVVLNGGRIVEDGNPDALMRRDGPFRSLVMHEMGRLPRKVA
jgi:ATP-binding cassette subfamily B protein